MMFIIIFIGVRGLTRPLDTFDDDSDNIIIPIDDNISDIPIIPNNTENNKPKFKKITPIFDMSF